MEQEPTHIDRDRMLVYAVVLASLVGVALYVIAYLTIAVYGPLNETGVLMVQVALFVCVGALLLALGLAMTAHSPSLATGLSGMGWILIVGGIALFFPAFAAINSRLTGISRFGGAAGALFVLMSGVLLQIAERSIRERQSAGGDPE